MPDPAAPAPATPDPNAPPAPGAETETYVQAHYGYAGWALDHPELGPLLRQAAAEGWDEARLTGAVQATNWWKSTSDTARSWDVLSQSDPASAWQQIGNRLGEIERQASQLGVTIRDGRMSNIVRDSLRYGWDAEAISRALYGEARFDPQAGGTIGTTTAAIRGRAAEFGIPMSEREAFRWSVKVGTGMENESGLDAELRTQAEAMFPSMVNRLKNGATVTDIAKPYLDMAGQLLEIDPAQIRLSDPKFSALFQGDRMPSLDEVNQRLMTDQRFGWDQTRNAREDASRFTSEIGQMFGVM